MEIFYQSIGKDASQRTKIHLGAMSMINDKIRAEHLRRYAYVYVRQSTSGQVIHHRESQRLQYGLVERAKELGWSEENIRVIEGVRLILCP